MRKLFVMFFVLIMAVAAMAQVQAPTPDRQGTMTTDGIIEVTNKAYYVLRAGVAAKMNLRTLEVEATRELFGPAPAMPQGNMRDNAEAFRTWNADRAKRTAPAMMFAKDNALVVVIGTNFFRLNLDTLAPIGDAKDFMSEKEATAAAVANPRGGFMQGGQGQPVVYKVYGDNLFLLRNTELVVINVKDGGVLARNDLPEQMTARNQNPRAGGNAGGGGRRGGGANANPPQN